MGLEFNLKALHRFLDTEPAFVGENLEHSKIDISISLAEFLLKFESDGSFDGNIGRSAVDGYLLIEADELICEVSHWVVAALKVLIVLAVEIVNGWRNKIVDARLFTMHLREWFVRVLL